MLTVIKIELGHIPDPHMYILFYKATRDKISYIPKRYSKTKYIQNLIVQNKNRKILYT